MKTLSYRKQTVQLQKFVTDETVSSDTLEKTMKVMFHRFKGKVDNTCSYQIVWHKINYMVYFDAGENSFNISVVKYSAYDEPTNIMHIVAYGPIKFDSELSTMDMHFCTLLFETYAQIVYQA